MLLVIGFMAGRSWDSLYRRSTHCREEMCTWLSSCDDVRMVAHICARDMRVLLSPALVTQSLHPSDNVKIKCIFLLCCCAFTCSALPSSRFHLFSLAKLTLSLVQPCQAHAFTCSALPSSRRHERATASEQTLFDVINTHAMLSTPQLAWWQTTTTCSARRSVGRSQCCCGRSGDGCVGAATKRVQRKHRAPRRHRRCRQQNKSSPIRGGESTSGRSEHAFRVNNDHV
jgi:hypothetical protein